jgi:tetratricopeptide (TPR) repeat protein
MNTNNRLLLTIIFTCLILIDNLYAGINARLTLYIGSVSIERNSKKIIPVSGMSLTDGDILIVGENSNANILTNESFNLRITGPKKFILNETTIAIEIKKSEEINSLINKLSKNSPVSSKRTLVFAVRGFASETRSRGVKKANRNESFDKDLKDAADAYEDGDYTKAISLFEIIIRKQDIPDSAKINAEFITAEIYFKKADYGKALSYYKNLDYKTGAFSIENREIILVRLVLCSDLTGDPKSKKKYLNEYFSIFENDGSYKDLMKSFN